MYTSPFLEEFEERIQINGVNIPKDELAKATSDVKNAIDKVIEEGFENPTQFEIITAIMFYYFATMFHFQFSYFQFWLSISHETFKSNLHICFIFLFPLDS